MHQHNSLVRPLFSGPLDLIGDVHGELATLQALLRHLGYDTCGDHPAGRRLVFVGDLVDRGPDSPGVVEFVRGLVDTDRAQCVLGNHELNILRGQTKEGTGWFVGNHSDEKDGAGVPMPQRALQNDDERSRCTQFFETLPVALERADLRVVHSCWAEKAIQSAREATSVMSLFGEEERRIRREIEQTGLAAKAKKETLGLAQRGMDLRKKSTAEFPFCQAIGQKSVLEQSNAIKELTSGPETLVEPGRPFFVGGKWRMVKREPWWESYDGDTAVVVGHYWRGRQKPGGMATKPGEPDPLNGVEPNIGLGPRGLIHVVDYSVGLGYKRRHGSLTEQPHLAALRWPSNGARSTDVPPEVVFQPLVP